MNILGVGLEIPQIAIQVQGDTTPGGANDVLLLALSDGTQGLLLSDGTSFLKLAASS